MVVCMVGFLRLEMVGNSERSASVIKCKPVLGGGRLALLLLSHQQADKLGDWPVP